jgi:SET domain-containing protein
VPKRKPQPSSGAEETPAISRKHANFELSIRPSEIHRWGVFAEEDIPKGRKIIEYTGERISRAETARRADGPLNYLFTLDSYWTLDGSVGGSGAQYINHSCKPNCYAWIFRGHILYMAARDIRGGEELTIDYRFEPDVPAVRCACGTDLCRGTINLKREGRLKREQRNRKKVGRKKSASKRRSS